MKVADIYAREILDSRGIPTLEAEVTLENGIKALGCVPSGASTGTNEAVELRDKDQSRYKGMGVLKAIENVKSLIKQAIVGEDAYNQAKIDQILIDLDGTKNKERLGANAILGVSMAVCRAAARSQKIPLFQYFGQLSGNNHFELPQPLILVLEGGKHGAWSTDIQEYFVIPKKKAFSTFAERLRAGAEIFHTLEKVLSSKNYSVGVGLEGAFMPKEIKSNEQAFQLITEAVEKSGYKTPDQILLGIDAASSEFYENGKYHLKSEGLVLSPEEWQEKILGWLEKYPIWSLEDMFAEEDWENWQKFTRKVGVDHQVVGDDLLVTNVERIKRAITENSVNSVLVKLNQIGTVTETISAIKLTHSSGFTTVISHRSGETNDEMIADLCVGCGSWQSKFGGPDRGERVAKYNRLLRIEERLNA
ncbi:MAG: phosphopyruvate hydratase [Microgenomates group bacterium]